VQPNAEHAGCGAHNGGAAEQRPAGAAADAERHRVTLGREAAPRSCARPDAVLTPAKSSPADALTR
jgi:hypothetical protein